MEKSDDFGAFLKIKGENIWAGHRARPEVDIQKKNNQLMHTLWHRSITKRAEARLFPDDLEPKTSPNYKIALGEFLAYYL